MSNDEKQTMAEGDDAFAGGVGDALPGQDGDAQADQSGMGTTRPTSPAHSAASAAAARAAYQDAGRSAPHGEPVAEHAEDETTPTADAADGPVESAASTESADQAVDASTEPAADGSELSGDALLAAERLADYQRLQAEYVNYKRRVDRDREEVRARAVAGFVESLLPVLDEIHLAREHGELGENTPFAKIAGKLEGILAKHGVSAFGEVGEAFDPTVHEALMHTQADLPEGTTETTVVMVMQPGYRMGDRVVRPARVSVADPA